MTNRQRDVLRMRHQKGVLQEKQDRERAEIRQALLHSAAKLILGVGGGLL